MYFGVIISLKARSDGNNVGVVWRVLMLILGLLMGVFFGIEFWDAVK